jgi:uncharacterized protein
MDQPFLILYRFFNSSKGAFWSIFLFVIGVLAWGATRVNLEEDITKFFPNDERVGKLNYIFQNSKISERLVLMVSIRDSATAAAPDSLVAYADRLVDSISRNAGSHLNRISAKVDDSGMLQIFSSIQNNLPVYLDDTDYSLIDSLSDPLRARATLLGNYKQLISPGGIVMKNVIVDDPLGFSFPVLKRLQHLQFDENFELYENYIVTRDHRHLLIFLEPKYPVNETKNNAALQKQLDGIIKSVSPAQSDVTISYFGGSVVAVGNALQLQQDTLLTVSLMMVLLLATLLGFFRKKRIPFLILVPVAVGALFALAIIGLFKPSLSILALAVGAVILGVGVDYSLHYLVQLKETRNNEEVIRHLAKPLTIGSLTTVVAFLCLQFTNASVLQDIGLFAALSLTGAALSSLIFLPHLISPNQIPASSGQILRRFSEFSFESKKWIVYVILLLTPVFLYFAGKVSFNSDMNKLNFMTDETRLANQRLESINRSSLSSIYVVSSDTSIEGALRKNEHAYTVLNTLQGKGTIQKLSSVSRFMISDSLQRSRIDKWNSFWTMDRKERFKAMLNDEATALGFSKVVIRNFDSLISKTYHPVSNDSLNVFRSTFFDDQIIEKGGLTTLISIVNADPSKRSEVYKMLESTSASAIDKLMLTSLFVEYVHADFNYIVNVTSLLVFLALLISYGRIELTLITFIPMLVTWIWILGIMALLGIEFNIVNVMVSTFIFGLGDDYSIFIMDGLQNEYRSGRKTLPSIRTSILLSAFTTISGLGVLIFAKHPALRSIAAISIIGIVCVFLMSLILQPYFFRALISDRTKRGLPPVTLLGAFKTFYTYFFFAIGSFLLTFIGLILKLIPFQKEKIRLLFHQLIQKFTWFNLFLAFNLKKRIWNKTPHSYSRASIIIANHSSFLDILLTTSLHPKLILLTNKWVYNSPVFGGVVRLADYYPVMEGAEGSIEQVRERVDEGYSVVVFPEGTRSEDGKIKRFHKGAFFMAEQLNIPIQPLLIHGADNGIRKGDMYLNDSVITLKFLPAILPDDQRFGKTYPERTKLISRYFRDEHASLKRQSETPDYFYHKLVTNYVYKGPVLEWYLRIKVGLEKNYAAFNELVPLKARVLDLGCGYGFLAYMLQFLSEERIITAVDYDEEKIETAQNGYLKSDRLNFYHADVTRFPLQTYDVIIISDVLHYLETSQQEVLISRCFAALNPGGKLIIRDGNRDLHERHQGTKLTEFFSVKLLKFNKSTNELNFISGRELTEKAREHGLTVEIQDETHYTSNVIFVISKPETVHAEV